MENPLRFFWIFKENYFLEHLSTAISNLLLFTTLLPRMFFTSVALQIKFYRNDVVWALVQILNFIFYLKKIVEFSKFSETTNFGKSVKVPQMD